MSLTENEVCTFSWSIDNFSMCPHICGERIDSPKFSVDILEDTEWQLQLYPRGHTDEDQVSAFLYYCGAGHDMVEVTVGIKMTIKCAATGATLLERTDLSHTFAIKKGRGWHKLVAREEVFAHKDKYLPNDSFTIIFSMWCPDKASKDGPTNAMGSVSLSQSIFETAVFKEVFSSFIRTIIKVRKRNFSWPIKNFSSLRVNQRLSVSLLSYLVDVPSFYLTFYLSVSNNQEQLAQIEIRRKEADCSNNNFVSCQISVVNTPKRDFYHTKEEHLFEQKETGNVWNFPLNIEFSKLEEEKYLETTGDVLYLCFEFTFSQLEDVCHTDDLYLCRHEDQSILFSKMSDHLKNHLKDFSNNGEYSDVTLRAKDRIFKVHKIILGARSSVFRAMFKNAMNERETGVVDINDLSPDTVDRMLSFMYSDTLVDLNHIDAFELYTAADKYQVLPLKFKCFCVLKSTLSVLNVCDVLRLADLHNDQDLRDAVQDFVHSNSRIILRSPEWKDLMKCDPGLAADVMYKMFNNNLL